MTNGFYSIAYTGMHGAGFGVFALKAGVVAGADVAGSRYEGAYRENLDGTVTLTVKMHAPAGVALVQTGVLLPAPVTLPLEGILPKGFDSGEPILFQTELGPLNLAIRKICDFPQNF